MECTPNGRHTVIHVTEHAGNVIVDFSSDRDAVFSLKYKPQKFADPRVAELEGEIAHKNAEIAQARHESDNATFALAEARKRKSSRRRR